MCSTKPLYEVKVGHRDCKIPFVGLVQNRQIYRQEVDKRLSRAGNDNREGLHMSRRVLAGVREMF